MPGISVEYHMTLQSSPSGTSWTLLSPPHVARNFPKGSEMCVWRWDTGALGSDSVQHSPHGCVILDKVLNLLSFPCCLSKKWEIIVTGGWQFKRLMHTNQSKSKLDTQISTQWLLTFPIPGGPLHESTGTIVLPPTNSHPLCTAMLIVFPIFFCPKVFENSHAISAQSGSLAV